MLQSSPFALGATFLLLGLIFLGLSIFLIHVIPEKFTKLGSLFKKSPVSLDIPNHHDGILLVQTGGRLLYANDQVKSLFALKDEMLDLESLVQLVQPSELFLSICAQEGRAVLEINGAKIQATSYQVPGAPLGGMVVIFQNLEGNLPISSQPPMVENANSETSKDHFIPNILFQLFEAFEESSDLNRSSSRIIDLIETLVPFEKAEIMILEEDLDTCHLFSREGKEITTIDQRKHEFVSRIYLDDFLSNPHPFLIENSMEHEKSWRKIFRNPPGFSSCIGMPLLNGNEFVGVLTLTSNTAYAFTSDDLSALQALSTPIALFLKKTLLIYKKGYQEHIVEQLAHISQYVGVDSDIPTLCDHLVKFIAPLLEVELFGLLIYDFEQHILRGVAPFYGLPPDFIELYSVNIAQESKTEELLSSLTPILANDALDNQYLQILGLEHVARACGIVHTALFPLVSNNRLMGYLQAANKHNQQKFNQDDLQVMELIANQVAPILGEIILGQFLQRQTQQVKWLRQIIELTNTVTDVDVLLKNSIQTLADQIKADFIVAVLLNEKFGELQIHQDSMICSNEGRKHIRKLKPVSIGDKKYADTSFALRSSLIIRDLRGEEQKHAFYVDLTSREDVNTLLAVPLISGEQDLGEILIGSRLLDDFDQDEIDLINLVAAQIAVALDRIRLKTHQGEDLQQKVDRFASITRLMRKLNATADLEKILEHIFVESLRVSSADCGTVYLLGYMEKDNSSQIIRYRGDSPNGTLNDLEQVSLKTQQTIVVEDYQHDTLWANLDGFRDHLRISTPHEGMRSSVVVPLLYQESPVGLIHLHSKNPKHFTPAIVELLEFISLQASIQIGHAYYSEQLNQQNEMLRRRVEILSKLLDITGTLQANQTLEQSLGVIAEGICATTPFNIVLMSVYDEKDGLIHRVSGVGLTPEEMQHLRATPQSWESLSKLFQQEYLHRKAYFIPYEKMPILPADIHVYTPLSFEREPEQSELWHPEDLLFIPLLDSLGSPLGLISVDDPRDGLRPDQPSLEALETFAGQAALIIELWKRIQNMRSQIQELNLEIERMQQSVKETQSILPLLLHKDLEQTLAISRLNKKVQRIRAGLEIAEIVSSQKEAEHVLQTLGRELLAKMDFDVVLIAESSFREPRLMSKWGSIPETLNIEALFGQRNPLHHSLISGDAIFVSSLDQDSQWRSSALLGSLDTQGFISLPIIVKNQPVVGVLAISHTPLFLSKEDEQLFSLLTQHVSIALQNIEMLSNTRRRLDEVNLLLDFSREISILEPRKILETLINSIRKVVPAAQAGLVAFWDSEKGCLVPRMASGYSNDNAVYQMAFTPGKSLFYLTYETCQPYNIDDVAFGQHYCLSSENLLAYREATGGRLPTSCLFYPIKKNEASSFTRSSALGILVLENFSSRYSFTPDDQALVASLVHQAVLTLENLKLFEASQQRAQQLQALMQISTVITSNLQWDELVASLLDQLHAVISFDTSTLWIKEADQLVIRAVRGFENVEERIGLVVNARESQLLNEMILKGKPMIVGDIREDPRFPKLDAYPYFSWMGIPLVSKGETLGVITLEKCEPNYYSVEYVQMVTTFANQAAVALENARLYKESLLNISELHERSQRLALLNRLSNQLSRTMNINHIYEIIIKETIQAINCSAVSILMLSEHPSVKPLGTGPLAIPLQPIVVAEYPSTPLVLPHALPAIPLFERVRQSRGVFITDNAVEEKELRELMDYFSLHSTKSLLIIPMASAEGLHGLLFVHSNVAQRFSSDEVELARTIGNQAAIAIQNARLFEETRQLTMELEERVNERTSQLEREHQRTVALLRIITELSSTLDLEQVLNRTLVVLKDVVSAEHISCMLWDSKESKLRHAASIGYTQKPPPEGRIAPFDANKGLAGWVIANRKPVLIADVLQDPRWVHVPGVQTEHRSAIAVPLMIGDKLLGVLLFFHRQPDRFSEEHLDLVQAAANQVAIAINNAELYNLIRNQTTELSNLLRNQQIETSQSRAILESIAEGVLVTDSTNKITLFNASAERILALKQEQVVGRSLEQFIGLFGGAAESWVKTIRNWSKIPSTHSIDEVYSERITLEDGRVISVQLAPVFLKNEFLGTVSIFHDITHQVEVDRLKDEFVATVSHELRTPMTSIKGYVEILLMGAAGTLNEQQTRFLEIVKENTERLTILVNDLLDISRIESGRVALAFQPLEIGRIAEEAINELKQRSMTDAKPMTFLLECEKDTPRVVADPERVRQIFMSLLINAYNYTEANGQIIVRIHMNGEKEVQIDVKDTGIGIPFDEQPRVFERFYRGEHPLVLATSGTGLGLAIVKRLVEMHQGRIWLESSGIPGKGSTFSFTLPCYKTIDE